MFKPTKIDLNFWENTANTKWYIDRVKEQVWELAIVPYSAIIYSYFLQIFHCPRMNAVYIHICIYTVMSCLLLRL